MSGKDVIAAAGALGLPRCAVVNRDREPRRTLRCATIGDQICRNPRALFGVSRGTPLKCEALGRAGRDEIVAQQHVLSTLRAG